jgi:hypothetical protein
MKKIKFLFVITILVLLGNGIFAQAPVLYYKFENNPTTTTTPNCGYPMVGSATGILSNVTYGSGGQFDTCLVGTGLTSSGIATGWSWNPGQKSWTISMWVSIPTSASGSAYYFFGDAGNSFRCFHNGFAGPDNLVLRGTGITDVVVTGTGPAATVVTFVYDSATSQIKAYKNGVLNATVPQTPLNLTGGTGFTVGSYSASTNFIGSMDEFRVFNRALSDGEVAAIWNQDGLCGEEYANHGLLLPTPGVNTNYVSIPYTSAMDGITNITIEAWVKVGGFTTANTILNKGGSSFDYQLGINSTGVPFFRIQGTIVDATGITLNAGEWTHLAVTYDGANAKFYKNGVLGSTVPATTALGTSTNEMRIGRGNSDPGSGVIEELRLWSAVRTQAEINQNKCKKYPDEFSSNTGLKALWHFDYNLTDSISGLNGVINGTIGYELFNFPDPAMPCSCSNTSSSISPAVCFSYTSPSGNYIWTTSGIYNDTIFNNAGCDSIITINLTINTVDNSVVQNGIYLTANAVGVTYQWVDCDNAYAIIPAAIDANFTATINGNYAVIVSGTCVDTSACYNVTTVGIVDNTPEITFSIFPNPNKGEFTISTSLIADEIRITDILGREIMNLKPETNKVNIDLKDQGEGFYMIEVKVNNQQKFARVIVNQ